MHLRVLRASTAVVSAVYQKRVRAQLFQFKLPLNTADFNDDVTIPMTDYHYRVTWCLVKLALMSRGGGGMEERTNFLGRTFKKSRARLIVPMWRHPVRLVVSDGRGDNSGVCGRILESIGAT